MTLPTASILRRALPIRASCDGVTRTRRFRSRSVNSNGACSRRSRPSTTQWRRAIRIPRGAEIIKSSPPFRRAIPGILHHHERWDGRGYPDGLSGDDIPIEAAIIGLADAWETITSNRPYAAALSLSDALAEIRAGRGLQFSPVVVDALWDVAKRRPADVLPSDAPAVLGAVAS